MRNPQVAAAMPQVEPELSGTAGQWQLIWGKFSNHRLAVAGGIVVILLYLTAMFAECVAPYDPYQRTVKQANAPPTRIRIYDAEEHRIRWPFIYTWDQHRDPETLGLRYRLNTEQRHPLRILVRGDSYRLWGLFDSSYHLLGVQGEQKIYLLGADQQGRDLFSRVVYGTRISLTIGLIGVAMSFTLGIVLGGISGYFGGVADAMIQRVIEVLISIPSLPLWMALSAAIPQEWKITQVFFGITIILSLLGWPGMAREVRGKLLSLRQEDFVITARLDGAGKLRIILRHMIPSFLSHIIATGTLAIPGMIIGETSLSFLGIGLRPPAISWGVLLQSAQNIQAVASTPWLLLPAGFVIVAVLAFNFLGDGLRDAADPYE